MVVLIMLAGLRLGAESWSGVPRHLLFSPFAWVAVWIFVDRALTHRPPAASVAKASGWLAGGAVMCVGALGFEAIGTGWWEILLDGGLVVFGSTYLADGLRAVSGPGHVGDEP